MIEIPTDRNPVEVLAEDFIRRLRQGDAPTIAEYAERYPEYASDIHDLFPAALLLEDLKGSATAPGVGAPESPPPRRLGDFRILREIGRGGMGIVYEAEQVSLGRLVALKVLPHQAGMRLEQIERFRREAQAAGRLHHTNIVAVFGVGEQEGLHYYVMQLIDGEGLDRVLERLRVSSSGNCKGRGFEHPTQRSATFIQGTRIRVRGVTTAIDLNHPREQQIEGGEQSIGTGCGPEVPFPGPGDQGYFPFVARVVLQVADALAFAHGQGILHRDIKPANLIVDAAGTVRVTDFGLAKLLAEDDLTRPGEMAGTLRYSAPERFQGKGDARSDLYSLGLTLYELLTLRPAYHESDPARLVLQVTRPTIASPRAVNPRVPRDLETIALRALAPEPGGRYADAQELADDLRRFLDDRPIKARRTSALEHLTRWCRRNPAIASLSAALVLVFLVGFAGVVWQWREASANLRQAKSAGEELRDSLTREAAQRREAENQKERAQGNLDLALQAFERIASRLALSGGDAEAGEEAAAPVVSPEAAVVLQDLVRFYERFAAQNNNDPRLKRDSARALRKVGSIRLRLGEYAEADKALAQAEKTFAAIKGADLERAGVMNDRGVVARLSGRSVDAVRGHQAALELLSKIPKSPQTSYEQARAYNLLGSAQFRTMRRRDAERSQNEALRILEELLKNDPKNPEYRLTQARASHELSVALWWSKKQKDGMAAKNKALEILEQLVKEFPQVPDYAAELAGFLLAFNPGTLGPRPSGTKGPRDMEKRCRRAVELSEGLTRRYPAVPDYKALLGRAQHRSGMIKLFQGKSSEAVRAFEDAERAARSLVKRFPSALAYKTLLAETRLGLADALRVQNKFDRSVTILRQSIDELKTFNTRLPRARFARDLLSRHYRSLAASLTRQGKKSEAAAATKEAEALRK